MGKIIIFKEKSERVYSEHPPLRGENVKTFNFLICSCGPCWSVPVSPPEGNIKWPKTGEAEQRKKNASRFWLKMGAGQSNKANNTLCLYYFQVQPFLARKAPEASVFGHCPIFFNQKRKRKYIKEVEPIGLSPVYPHLLPELLESVVQPAAAVVTDRSTPQVVGVRVILKQQQVFAPDKSVRNGSSRREKNTKKKHG